MARPTKPIDPVAVEKLAAMGLSAELIAGYLDVDHRTIERRFAPILKKGHQKRDARLMVKLYQEAMGTPDKPGVPGKPSNTAALIFCAKNWLGMSDRPDTVISIQQNQVYPFQQVRVLAIDDGEFDQAAGKPNYQRIDDNKLERIEGQLKIVLVRQSQSKGLENL
jgi:hypothetical protein